MNSKKIILLGCVEACVFSASTATAQMRGHGGSMPRMGMRGAPMSHSMGRMPMHHGPMMNSPSGLRRFGGRDFNRNDRFGRFNRFNNGRFVRDNRFNRFNRFNDGRFARFDRFHRFNRFNRFNDVVFIGNFGFPGWWGWGWGYPYGYYGYGHSGSGYGYGDSSGSRVAELQSRLARAGYYYGSIDGIMGPRLGEQ